MTRPENLPDFRKPPLNEVVLGVQFKPVPGYQQIRAGEVWALYKEGFSRVQELPALAPAFEIFGPAGTFGALNFEVLAGPTHDRFWFTSENKEEIIQFQHDRLLHNWRKVGDQTNEYPRFEKMIIRFEAELGLLHEYFLRLAGQGLTVTQCEISYVNHILSTEASKPISAKDWLRFLDFGPDEPEDFSVNFRRTIASTDGKPLGRLIGEASTAVHPRAGRMIVLTLTARGAPAGSDVAAALDFLKLGRELVVSSFAKVTTDSAHAKWERVQ